MSDDHSDSKPGVPRPPNRAEVPYDLERALSSVVSVRSRIPHDAMTASLLGTERAGHGVIINDDGLVLTIGYLVTEAETVWLVDGSGRSAPAHVVAYDQETGFGLLQALQRLGLPALPIGSSAALQQDDPVIFAGQGGIRHAVDAKVILKREFAGYWEYLLDEAIFTAPAHPNWGGGALLGPDGTLRGIGSLLVQHVTEDEESFNANMVVPIDLLNPILDDLLKFGRVNRPPRPWLGMMTTEYEGHLVVAGVIEGGPAEASGIEVGDVVLEVAGTNVTSLAHMFREVWTLGEAGVSVPLMIYRKDSTSEYIIESASRNARLKTPKLH
ncbi:MAG: S1C family serine protease [Gammaproteobacteria bacterium]|nr:S1C family serine protease [Gammaproteobacteria bacterium]